MKTELIKLDDIQRQEEILSKYLSKESGSVDMATRTINHMTSVLIDTIQSTKLDMLVNSPIDLNDNQLDSIVNHALKYCETIYKGI